MLDFAGQSEMVETRSGTAFASALTVRSSSKLMGDPQSDHTLTVLMPPLPVNVTQLQPADSLTTVLRPLHAVMMECQWAFVVSWR
jgi:hypothetical protein